MVNLTTEDRQKLINILRELPDMVNERGRLALLRGAGLEKLVTMMDTSGSPFVAASEISNYLASYGRLTYEHEALGVFLNGLKEQGVLDVHKQAFVDLLLNNYQMMTPVASQPKSVSWKGHETTEEVLEKIIGEDTLRSIAFLEEGLRVSRAVAYVGVGSGSGTGFLVSTNLFLTNNHVIPDAQTLSSSIFRFNYQENFLQEVQLPREYRAKAGGVFRTSPVNQLDYTILELEGEPGKEWGWLPIQSLASIQRDGRVNIIQHPSGLPKRISFQNNYVEYIGGNVVQYITSTKPGSSGSPVFNDGWQVVALHHAGGMMTETTTQRRYLRNEGILINKILADLPIEIRLKVAT